LPDFVEDVNAVLAGGKMIERRIEQEDAAHLLLRISPYRNSSSGQLDGIVVTFVDVTLVTNAEMRQRVLIAELNHRVKNMLTIAIGLAHQTLKTAPTIEAFKESFISRLHAMARSYELVARDNWTKAAIQELIEMELSPFGLDRVSMQGPPIDLKPSQALSFGMVLHELATNAAKYGALSMPGGRILLHWSVTNEEPSRCEFVWSEQGGPEVEKPKRQGFGVKLIENEVRYNLGGTSRVEFLRRGLTVRVGLNLEETFE
jgi:two-component system CheB/CheR fusion protein